MPNERVKTRLGDGKWSPALWELVRARCARKDKRRTDWEERGGALRKVVQQRGEARGTHRVIAEEAVLLALAVVAGDSDSVRVADDLGQAAESTRHEGLWPGVRK